MRAASCVLAAILLTGCPAPDLCPGAPDMASVTVDVVTGPSGTVVPEGGGVPFVRGIQGSDMAVFSIAYGGPDTSDCLRRELVVRSAGGAALLGRGGAVELERHGELWLEPELQVIEPPSGPLVVEVEAYDTTLVRTVIPTGTPQPTVVVGPMAGTVGAPAAFTVRFDRPAPREWWVDIAVDPLGAAEVEPSEVFLLYGETEAAVTITPVTSGTLSIVARTYDFGVFEASATLTVE